MKDKKIKANGMTQIMMDLLPKRVESNVYLNHKMDFTNLKKYLENVKKKIKQMIKKLFKKTRG